MIGYLIRLILKLARKNYLIQFFDGLNAIGKPTHVLYPAELLEQAALLGLSGLNNTLAIQSNQHWIWPYWVERQLNPDSDGFIPTGVNLLTNNLSFRNWTALSIPGNRMEAMLDPVGMLTLEPFSWSVMPYLIVDNDYYIPSKMDFSKIQQSVHKRNWPEIITRYQSHPQIKWQSKCKALEFNQQQILLKKVCISNTGATPKAITFGVTLRPYNSLTIGHIHKLSCKKNLWKVNGSPAMLMLQTPDYIDASNRLLGDPVFSKYLLSAQTKRNRIKLKSRSGISTGIAIYNITLNPGEQVSYEFLCSDRHSRGLNLKKKNREWNTELKQAEKQFKENWKQSTSTGLNIHIPDNTIQNAFYTVKNHLNVFDDVDQFTPGSFFYHTGWFRDSAFLSLGFDQVGFFDRVENKFSSYFKCQTFRGYFKSQDGEWDSTGQALFSIITHIRRSGNTQLLYKYYSALLKGVKWINNTRLKKLEKNSPHYGLLPAGLSAEHFGPNDHYYWDNFWSLAGIEQMIWCADYLKKSKDTLWLKTVFEQYSVDLQTSILNVSQRTDNQALPCSPYRWMDTAAIGNLAAITPMQLINSDEFWVTPSLNYLWDNSVRDGLFFQHIIHSGLNIYLSIQLAKVFLIRQDQRWQIMLKAILNAASPTWTWPEAIHPKTGGGCMGDGDHGWAAAEFVSLIRDMFVFEHQNALFLGAGLFNEWYDLSAISADNPSPNIQLDNASTLYGTVSYVIEKQDHDIVLRWNITRNTLQNAVPVYFICPRLIDTCSINEEFEIVKNNTAIQLNGDSGECRFYYSE